MNTTNEASALADGGLDKLRGRLQHAIDKGPLPSLQFAVARHGKLVLFETLGNADNTTRYNVFSCTKPVVASAIWQLMGASLIRIEAPVAHYIPAFAENGKQAITVEQVLCHTAGFPRAPLSAPAWWTRAGRLEAMRDWRLNWEPGSQMEYHPLSAHWVLAELIECITGRDYREYLQANIIAPLGLEQLRLGVPVAEQGDIATLQHVGEPPTSKEIRDLFGAAIEWPSTVDHSLLMFNEPEVRELGVPGGGAVSTAADMALFYQGVMNNSGELWQPEVLADAIGRVRVHFPDPMTGAPANRGLGVVIAGDDKYLPHRGMGSRVSGRAFGHQGVGGQVAWGDPVSGLSFCLLTNGLDANLLRSAQLCAAASNRAAACWPG
ncbi:MAG: beta-lactamase family protein [Halioglobus sp.]|nr:beta-lactamase family protein [Halioglobus sp.]